jgi:hypothetical protein
MGNLSKRRSDMKRMFLAIFFILFLFGGIIVNAGDEKISVEGRYFMPTLSATLKVSDSLPNPTKVDDDMLNIKRENFVDIRASIKLAESQKLRLSYMPISYSGRTTITQDIVFGDQRFVAGQRVLTDLDMDYLRLGWFYKLIKKEGVDLSAVLEAKGYIAKARLQAPDQGARHTYKVKVGIPTVGLSLDAGLGKGFGFLVEGTGISAGSRGYLYDLESGLKWVPHRNFSVDAGYRIYEVKFEKGDDYFKMKLGGPYLGVRILF